MTGYLFLFISVFSGVLKGYCGKCLSEHVKSLKGTVLVNLERMLFCVIIGFLMILLQKETTFQIDFTTAMITILSGLSTAVFVILWITSIRTGTYVMVDVFIMLGVAVTVILCRIFLNEEIFINQYIGLILLVVSAFIMCSYNSTVKERSSFREIILLVGLGISNGMSDFSQKLFVYYNQENSVSVFNLYTYLFAFLAFSIFYSILNVKHNVKNDVKNDEITINVVYYIITMSVCLFANTYFKTLVSAQIPAATLYPLSTGITLILSVLMASMFFKEKASLKCICGVVMAFISLVVINI